MWMERSSKVEVAMMDPFLLLDGFKDQDTKLLVMD